MNFSHLAQKVLLVICLFVKTTPIFAQSIPEGLRSPFWHRIENPSYTRAEELFFKGLERLDAAQRTSTTNTAQRQIYFDSALTRLRLAHQATPNDPEILFSYAIALAWSHSRHPTNEQLEQTINAFLRLREIDPMYAPETVAFELGILYTKSHRYLDAAHEDQRAVIFTLTEESMATTYNNLGETTMINGDLERAIIYYERAVELARRNNLGGIDGLALALYGLAVAQHRLGDLPSALASASEAISFDGSSFAILHSSHVFFEPDYEKYEYLGVGYLALAQLAQNTTERNRHLVAAQNQFRQFLNHGGTESPYASVAQHQLEVIATQLTQPSVRPSQSRNHR